QVVLDDGWFDAPILESPIQPFEVAAELADGLRIVAPDEAFVQLRQPLLACLVVELGRVYAGDHRLQLGDVLCVFGGVGGQVGPDLLLYAVPVLGGDQVARVALDIGLLIGHRETSFDWVRKPSYFRVTSARTPAARASASCSLTLGRAFSNLS